MKEVIEASRLRIRPFDYSDADYETVIMVENTIWADDPDSVTMLKEEDSTREANYYFNRQIIELDGEVVGNGIVEEPVWSYAPGKYKFFVNVLPAYQNRGIATTWYQQALDTVMQRDPKPTLLMASVREDHTASVAFVEKLGYQRVMRFQYSSLNLEDFDPTPFLPRIEAVEKAGIQLKTLTELMESDPDYQRKIYEMHCEIMKDVPYTDVFTPPPFEVYVQRVFGSGTLLPDAWCVAVDGQGNYVAETALQLDYADEDKLYTDFTGVLRSHRRMGIATAIKVKTLIYAKEVYGADAIKTDNEENNPMYQINVQLGFKPSPAWLDYEKHL